MKNSQSRLDMLLSPNLEDKFCIIKFYQVLYFSWLEDNGVLGFGPDDQQRENQPCVCGCVPVILWMTVV